MIIRIYANEFRPDRACVFVVARLCINDPERVLRVGLIGLKVQRRQNFPLRRRQQTRALVCEREVEVRLRMSRSKFRRRRESCDCGAVVVILEIQNAEVQEKIPLAQAELLGALIFAQLSCSIMAHPKSEPEVIVGERIVGIVPQNIFMQPDCLRIIFDAQRVISADVAN